MGQDIVGQNFVGQDVAGSITISLGQDVSGAGGSGAGSRESLFSFGKNKALWPGLYAD